jgi:hypothetical protein
LLLAAVTLVTTAHVGSPDVYFDGTAGPYAIRVIVRTAGVVPGLADITIRILSGGPVTTVSAQPARFDTGLPGAPPPDTAHAVSAGLYSAQVWLMRAGSYSLHVTVDGPAGKGTAVVPIVAVATRRLEFERPMAIGLIGLGLFLLVGAITIIRAAVGESELPAGQAPNAIDKTYGWVAAGTSGVLLVLAVVGGRAWWNSEDAAYRRTMYRPWTAAASAASVRGVPTLTFKVTDSIWRFHSPLIPDHGKLVHLFLVRMPQADAFAHLHPAVADSSSFTAPLPPLPTGHYRAFADIVFEVGSPRTLATDLELGTPQAGSRWAPGDPDDAYAVSPSRTSADTVSQLGGYLSMTWTRPATFTANAESDLRFVVRDAAGHETSLDSYMGMAAHAVVLKDDGSVFIHLHPNGTFSMAARRALALRQPSDTAPGSVARKVTAAAAAPAMSMAVPGTFSFPYAFPQPGTYHVWVQVKHGGKILTGAFSAEVH